MNSIPQSFYQSWESVAESASHNIESPWKQNATLKVVLEHVPFEKGIGFLTRILAEHKLLPNEIVELSKRNDSIGGGVVQKFDGLPAPVTPSSLRYIFHACEVLSSAKAKGQTSIRIVEVGCGYGGLALVLSMLAPRFGIQIQKYVLYDLPGPQALQKKFLETTRMPVSFEFPSCSDFGASVTGSGWWLVSAYSIGEFDEGTASKYLRTLIPRTQFGGGGFLIWNTHSVSPVVFQAAEERVCVEPEVPQTSVNNRVITW